MNTPTPNINIASTFYPIPYLSGWVGEILTDGTRVPEVNAYIYIYINGFLVNPPSFNEAGIYNSNRVFSDFQGNWKSSDDSSTLSSIYLTKGDVVTVQAKSIRKAVSDLSVPYTITGMVTPINLGITGDFNNFRAPKDGEFTLLGGLSYWTPDTVLTGKNRVLIFKDGYLLGEVLSNKIIGTDAIFPFQTDISQLYFSLLINGKVVKTNFSSLNLNDSIMLTPSKGDGVNTIFTFHINSISSTFKVYKNLRCNNFNTNSPMTDYYITINTNTNIATLTFSVPPTSSDLLLVYEVSSINTYYNQLLAGRQNGSNDTFVFVNNPVVSSVQIFQNGLHLKGGTDFNTQPDIDYKIEYDTTQYRYNTIFRLPPEVDDVLLVDYQRYDTTVPVLFSPTITTLNSLTFSLPLLQYPGRINVYKNGLIQRDKLSDSAGTHTLTYNTNNVVLTFDYSAIALSGDDVITVTYEYIPLYLDTFINMLNTSNTFKDNNLSVSVYNKNVSLVSLTSNYVTGNGTNQSYNLPIYTIPTTVRLFKNGRRLIDGTDYTIVNDFITFTKVNLSTDLITSIIQYAVDDIIVNGTFALRPTSTTQINIPLSPFRNMVDSDDSIQFYKNGLRLNPFGETPDFTVTENVLTLTTPYVTGDSFILDYQPASTGIRYIYARPFITIPNGINNILEFPIPILSTDWDIEVFSQGVKLNSGIDYYIKNNTVVFKKTPAINDVLLIDFYITQFNTTGYNPQLQFETNASLELVLPPADTIELATYRLLFGSKYVLNPGKDTDGDFLYYIRPDTGDWKYSNLDLTTHKAIPFNKGEHLKALALNVSSLNAAPSTVSEQIVVKDNFHDKYLYSYVPTCVKDIKDA
jgi:hypothetical protein